MNETHPLVDAYVDRLEALLDGAAPATRSEVVAGVREHLGASLADGLATDDDVRRVLAELGTPEQIADEAYAPAPTPARASAPSTPRLMERAWVPLVVMLLSLLWLVAPAVITVGSLLNSALAMHPVEALFLLVSFPVWPIVACLVGVSRLWTANEKVTLITALPAFVVWLLVLTPLPPVLGTVGGLIGVLVTAWVVVRTGRKGLSRGR